MRKLKKYRKRLNREMKRLQTLVDQRVKARKFGRKLQPTGIEKSYINNLDRAR